MEWNKKYIYELSYETIGAAIEVHRHLGPGLLESVYQNCLARELVIRDIPFSLEHQVVVEYKGIKTDTLLRSDFLIKDAVVLELKSVESLLPVHTAQLMTYMRLLQKPKGVLINFNVTNIFKEGQKTYVNNIYKDLPNT